VRWCRRTHGRHGDLIAAGRAEGVYAATAPAQGRPEHPRAGRPRCRRLRPSRSPRCEPGDLVVEAVPLEDLDRSRSRSRRCRCWCCKAAARLPRSRIGSTISIFPGERLRIRDSTGFVGARTQSSRRSTVSGRITCQSACACSRPAAGGNGPEEPDRSAHPCTCVIGPPQSPPAVVARRCSPGASAGSECASVPTRANDSCWQSVGNGPSRAPETGAT